MEHAKLQQVVPTTDATDQSDDRSGDCQTTVAARASGSQSELSAVTGADQSLRRQ